MPMLTLDQWKNARRVDHDQMVILGHVFNRRTRPRPPYADLKAFDADVRDYHTTQMKFDKIVFLGDLFVETSRFIANAPPNLPARYLTAARTLRDAAEDELSIQCGATVPAAQRAADILAMANGTALAPKAAGVRIFSLVPQGSAFTADRINALINIHLVSANALFNPAGLTVTRLNDRPLPIPATVNNRPVLDNGRFDELRESPFLLLKHLNAQRSAANVNVIYVERFKDDDVQGFTCRKGNVYSGSTADVPAVVVTLTPPPAGAATYGTTLAHELGHAIMGEGTHANDPDSLMAGGANRNGTNEMSLAMLSWLRNNSVV